jgi:cytochrome P450
MIADKERHWFGILKLEAFSSWAHDIPRDIFGRMRKGLPVVVAQPLLSLSGPRFSTTVVVALRKDVLEVLEHPEVFSTQTYQYKFNTTIGMSVLGENNTPLNNVEKPALRRLMPREDFPVIAGHVARLARESIREFAVVSPDAVSGRRHARLDVAGTVAELVPLRLMGEYFGFPGPDERTMLRWAKAFPADLKNLAGEIFTHAAAVKAGAEMKAYLADLVREKRANPARRPQGGGTILERMLLPVEQGGPGMVDERVISSTAGMLIGGGETIKAAALNALSELFARPAHLAGAIGAAKADDDVILAQYVWEALRFSPVHHLLPRYCEQDYILAKGSPSETRIPRHSLVLVSTFSAMFDEAAVDAPDEFRLGRPDEIYLHMGHGQHRCLGDYVSLIAIPQIVKAILLLRAVRIAPGIEGMDKFAGSGSPASFTVEFEPDE